MQQEVATKAVQHKVKEEKYNKNWMNFIRKVLSKQVLQVSDSKKDEEFNIAFKNRDSYASSKADWS